MRAPTLPRVGALLLAGLLSATPAYAADAPQEGVNMALAGGLAAMVVACAVVVAVNRAWGLAATAVAGVGVALYTTLEHLEIMHGGPGNCGTSAVVGCADVLSSKWSEIGGVPTSLLGFGFYLAMAWLAVRHAQGSAPEAPVLMVVGGVVGVGFDVFLGAQMVAVGKLCLLCLSTYGLNLVFLVGSTLLSRGRPFGASLGKAFGSEAGLTAVVGLVGLIGGVMWYQGAAKGDAPMAVGGGSDPAAVVAAQPGMFYEQVAGSIELTGQEPAYGDPGAKYTIVEWADFQCPHCARMWTTIHDWLPKNKDVRLLYKNYPISNKCNRFVQHEGHPQACGAAVAALCAQQQGRFWELASQMFGNQEYLSADDVGFMAQQVGLDKASFDACLQSPTPAQLVAADVDGGGKANISGTPSLFVKGLVGDGWVRLNAMEEDKLDVLFAAARSGKALPAPPPPNPEG